MIRPPAARALSMVLGVLLAGPVGAAWAQEGEPAAANPPAAPPRIAAHDFLMDGGDQARIVWEQSPDDPANVSAYAIYRSRTDAEIQKKIKDDRAKFIAGRKTEATKAILGEDWKTMLDTLTPQQRIDIRAARAEAAKAAAAEFDAGAMNDPASEDNRFLLHGSTKSLELKYEVDKLDRANAYVFMVKAVGKDFSKSAGAVTDAPMSPTLEWFDGTPVQSGGRFWLVWIVLIFCGAVVFWIRHARRGKPIRVRKIAGLEAVDEAVGRATEMGRPCLFVPGIQDMNDIQTIAGITVLARVARTAAEYDAKVEVPTARSLVMTTCRETVQAAYLSAGRPDAYNQDLIYYVTDEQFGYVAYLSGMMVREKPAACFYMGTFYAESLILAETGNAIGAIQIAGTAMPAQLPFFVAACDYTLIGEEFFAASAYLSGSPEELGSLKGQDLGKVIVAVLMILGIGMMTLASMVGEQSGLGERLSAAVKFLKDVILT